MIKVSDYIFEFLYSKGTDTVFTVSGGGCMHLIDSLGKFKKIKYICNHHEQACSIAAEGYARITNKPGVVLVTTGPGGTNAITGVLCAYQDSIPMIIISGQVPSDQLSKNTGCRQIGQQEFNIVSCVTSMTKFAKVVTNPIDIPMVLAEAYNIATTGRPGPVWIDIPLNVQSAIIDTNKCSKYNVEQEKNNIEEQPVNLFQELLQKCKRPVVVVGGGIRVSNTMGELRNFLDKTGIPALTGPHSAGDAINTDYRYYAGRFGLLGQFTSNEIIQESDLIISLGSRLNPKMIGYNSLKFAPNATKFVIDIDLKELEKLNINNKVAWNIDLKDFFKIIKNIKFNLAINDWQKYVLEKRSKERLVLKKHEDQKKYTSTYVFAKKLEKFLKEDSVIVTSDGTAHVIPLKTMNLKGNQRLFSNEGTAPMGYGLPASIGAYFGHKKPVICIEGDGSIMMNLQELETIRYHNIPLIIFIINNQGYLSIKQTQNSFFKGHLVGSDVSSGVSIPSFLKLSNVFDFKYLSIKTNSEIDSTLYEAFQEIKKPIIVEIFTDPNELHEPKVVSRGIDKKGNIIPGELTDMNINYNLI
jgi:acetolactate synthase-1/2/3 large subunit